MNRYLLLRDNKQSGPYTVPEILAKGIKPYDLVWLEGKSAAWRYPSEIEELKAYAPAVEEQPFDRFYKKQEAEGEKKQPERKSAFEPVVAEEPGLNKPVSPSQKVYINFPGGPKKVPVYQEPKKDQPVAAPVQAAPMVSEPAVLHPRQASALDRKLLYAAIAACLVLIVIILILIVNYGNQRSSIKQLNDMVQQMEKRQNERNQAANAVPVGRTIPAAAVIAAPVSLVGQTALPPSVRTISKTPVKKETTRVESATQQAPVTNQQQPQPPVQEKIAVMQPRETPAEDLKKLVSLKPNKFKTGMLGGISNLQLMLTNNSPRELQHVAVEINYFSPEKKLVKTQTVYFEKVAPGGQPVVNVPKSNRGVTIAYSVSDVR